MRCLNREKHSNNPRRRECGGGKSGTLSAGTLTLNVAAPYTSSLPFVCKPTAVSGSRRGKAGAENTVSVLQLPGRILVVPPDNTATIHTIALVTIQGKSLPCPVTAVRSTVTMDTRKIEPGVYTLLIGKKAVRTLLIVR